MSEYVEVGGQTEALDLLWTMLDRDIEAGDLFELHEALMPPEVRRPGDPVGRWKTRPNGIRYRLPNQEAKVVTFMEPARAPEMRAALIKEVNRSSFLGVHPGNEHLEFSRLHLGFVNVHPFFDGNGRMARMLANIPLLRSGLDPIMIPVDRLGEYLPVLNEWSEAHGDFTADKGLWPAGADWPEFRRFCSSCIQFATSMLEPYRTEQDSRA